MQRTVVSLVTVAALWASLAVAAGEQESSGTLEWGGGAAAFGLGVSWGNGVLHYGGYDYAFDLKGLDIADLGGSGITGSGTVYNLSRVEDFSGNYAGVGIGLTVAGGGSAGVVQNQNGIRIELVSTSQGLRAWLGGNAIHVNVPASTIAAVRALQSAEKSAARSEDAARRAEAGATRVEAAVERLEATLARAERRQRRVLGVAAARPRA
jgi:hypothetical protein